MCIRDRIEDAAYLLRKREREVKDNEQRYRDLFDRAPIAFEETDRDGLIRRFNQAVCSLLKCPPDQILGRKAWDFVAPDQQENFRQAMTDRIATGVESVSYTHLDEENIGRSLRMILEREGYSVNVCKSVADFGKHPDAGRADAYLFDMKLPDGNGIDLLKAVRQNGPASPAIMISGHGTIADAVEATRAGAFDFLEKPLSRDRVLLAVKNAIEQANLRQENERCLLYTSRCV